MNTTELLEFLADGTPGDAVSRIAPWVTGSRRFREFVCDNHTKIRKKLRTAQTPEALQSVLLELAVARCFVGDCRRQVEYERFGQGKLRSPDLSVTIGGRAEAHLEICRLQPPSEDAGSWDTKLATVVCNKLGQMVSEASNLLIIASAGEELTTEVAANAMKRLKERVQNRDELLVRLGFGDPSGFYKQFRWLSGIALWDSTGFAGLWSNPETRRPLDSSVTSVITRRVHLPVG